MFATRRLSPILIAAAAFVTLGACQDAVEPTPEQFHPKEIVEAAADPVMSAKFSEAATYPETEEVKDRKSVTTVDTVAGTNEVRTTEWIEEQVRYSASDNPQEFMQFAPNAGVLWPGNLVIGSTIASGAPQSLPETRRRPITVYLDVLNGDASGVAAGFSRRIDTVTPSRVNGAMNQILAGHKGNGPANYYYESREMHSASQINFKLNAKYSGPAVTVEGKFGFNKKDATTRMTVRLYQTYYTMSVDPFYGMRGAFDSTVTMSDLADWVSPQSPLAYIGSVTYGRLYFLTYETTAKKTDLEAALKAAYEGGVASGSVDAEAKWQEVMSQTDVKVTQIGGNAADGLATITGRDFKAIRDFMTRGANFSPTNPGAPISYTVKYLYDGTMIRMNSTMEYTITRRTPKGSSTAFTTSKFNTFVEQQQAWGKISATRGAMRFKVWRIDNTTGQESLVWSSPCNVNCMDWRASWGTGYVPWERGDRNPIRLDWTVPEFTVENRPGARIALECTAVNFEEWANPKFGSDRHIYGFDAGAGRWVLVNGPKDTRYCQATDSENRITVGVWIDFRINGQRQ